jgi:subtilisin family serine protease
MRSVIAVGAARLDGRLAPWSNRAGSTGERYLAAPGERLVTNCDVKVCQLVSGTSFSAPYVAAGVALLMEARPDLSAQEAAEVLLKNARRDGSPTEKIGRGFLDIGRAIEAAGQAHPTLASAG